jgi:hypothetical protein
MTLTLTPIAHDVLCHGSEWTVENIDVLAERVARVALGQYRHISQILEGLAVSAPTTTADHGNDALKKLKLDKNGNAYQRDGWLFQVISWIAASHSKQGAILKPPHPFHAHKGFDGIQLEMAADGKTVKAVVIFEDKATDDARGMLRDEVWPDIVDLEAGGRVAELTSEITSMLEAQQAAFPGLNVDEAINRLLWQEARRYRVSVTISDTHKSEPKRKGLFKDYDTSAPGDVLKRRAETMHFDNMREWMTDFSSRVETQIKTIAGL